MKTIRIMLIAALAVTVTASSAFAVTCNCAAGTCTVSTSPLIVLPISACPSCPCGGSSTGSGAATQPVTTQFLKNNYQVSTGNIPDNEGKIGGPYRTITFEEYDSSRNTSEKKVELLEEELAKLKNKRADMIASAAAKDRCR